MVLGLGFAYASQNLNDLAATPIVILVQGVDHRKQRAAHDEMPIAVPGYTLISKQCGGCPEVANEAFFVLRRIDDNRFS